jgi:hypothetical protein
MSSSQAERQLILLSAGTAARRQAMRDQAGRLTVAVDWHDGQTPRKLRLPTLGPHRGLAQGP